MNNLELAKNPKTDPEILDRLSYDESFNVREAVALNPNTPPKTLERLFYGFYWPACYFAITNPNTPQYIKDLHKFRQFLNWYTVE